MAKKYGYEGKESHIGLRTNLLYEGSRNFGRDVRDLLAWAGKHPKKSIPVALTLGGAILTTCESKPEWRALYGAKIVYENPGDAFGSLHEIGDTLVTKDKIIDTVVEDILNKRRPSYEVKDGLKATDENGNPDLYRFFAVSSKDDAEGVKRNTTFPSTRRMLPLELRAAADSMISRYESKQRTLDMQSRQEYKQQKFK